MSEDEKRCDCGCAHDHECDCGCAHDHECDCGGCHEKDAAPDPDACRQRPGEPAFKHQDPNKGVSLGPEVEHEVAEVMAKRYARFLKLNEKFTVKTEVCHHFGLVSSELNSDDRTTSVCIEVSVECEPNKIENPLDAYTNALDVLDLVWLDYFDSDRISHYLPIWQSYEIDDKHVNVRLEHSNPALDDEASAFLRAHGFLDGGLTEADYEDDY